MDFNELCKKIIFIDSTPEAGTEEIALFTADLCKQSGFDVHLQEANFFGKKQYNLIARPKNSSRNNEVIFQTHMDTVGPGPNAAWTQTDNNPFKATVKDGKIYGLGTADVKLDLLCKWKALKEFTSTQMRRPFVLVGTFAEEMGMEGAKLLMSSKQVDAKMAIIGEPSELKIVYANNGYAVCHFEIPFLEDEIKFIIDHKEKDSATTQEKVFHGKAVHSSTPHLGDNALLKLIDYVAKLPEGLGILEASGGTVINTVPSNAQIEVDANFMLPSGKMGVGTRLVKITREIQKLEREFLNLENKEFSPSTPTLNVGVLKTTEKGLKLSVSFRMTPQITKMQIDQWWSFLEKAAQKLNIRFVPERISIAALTPLDSELISGALEISKKLGLPDKPITKASGTECSVYRPYGIECMVIGPGVSVGNSHTANEYNILSQLQQASDFYSEAVKRFCI